MFNYYLIIAWRSLTRTPILTCMMILAIGLGIGASMTMITVLHVMTENPLPKRSSVLFHPYLNPLPLDFTTMPASGDPRNNFTWPDAMALLKARRAPRQAAMAGGRLLVWPARVDLQPFYVNGRYTTSDFFAMFGVPFVEGAGWAANEDGAGAHVIVINETLARKAFGTVNALGKSLRLGDITYRVIGVTSNWEPKPLFYADASANHYSDADQFFLPLSTAVENKLETTGNISSWGKRYTGNLRDPDTTWLQFWVQLDTPTQVQAYHEFLINYSAEQKALGRFQQPPMDAALYSLMGWLSHENLVPNDVRLQFWLALGFLGVCMVNTVALLLAKFLSRSGEISVRRAMGARKLDIFTQLGIESSLIGVVGGFLGLILSQIGLWSIRQRPDDYAHIAKMDPAMLLGTIILAIAVSVLAGVIPGWLSCRVPPAFHLKAM